MNRILLYLSAYAGIWLLTLGVAHAQTTIRGSVIDSKTKEPIPFATVSIKGTNTGTNTKADGSFELASKKLPVSLIFQYIGYKNQEINVSDAQKPIIIPIEESSLNLSEVVVIGYGSQKRSDFTGSIASLPTELITQPVSSPERLLQGSVAGVQVTQTTGQPGGGVTIRIRGGNSINAGNEPLYVIDGFPVYNSNSGADAGVTDGPKINPLSSLNTGDIESIDVLKDASATAIYGSRGANGVVLVTTKKGKKGQGSITYDGYYGVQEVIRTLPLMNATQWGYLKNDAWLDNGTRTTPYYTQEQLDNLGEGTNWQKEAFRIAPVQNHNLSILTGSEKTRFAISGNYYNQQGVLRNSDFIRYSGRLNFEHEYNSKFKIGSYITGSNVKSQVAPQAVVPNLLQMPPTVPVRDEEGNFILRSTFESQLANPINTLYNQLNETRTNRVLANAYGEYKLIEGLTAKVLVGTDLIDNKQNRYLPNSVYEGASVGGQASVGTRFTSTWLNENTLNYVKNFGLQHAFDVIVGFTQQKSVSKSTVTSAAGFASDDFSYNNLGAGTTLQQPSSSASAWVLNSFLGRANYIFDDRYYLTFTLRADGSSRFGKQKWGYFPSAALSWNLTNEDFFRQFTAIDLLKFRVSAGITGNQEIDPYQSLQQLSYYRYNLGNNIVAGYAPSNMDNPDLTWETTQQYDAGFDLSLLKNRINFVADLYYKKTTNLLLNVTLPYTTGYAQALQNYGSIENKGIELGLNTQNITGDFKWNTNIVFSSNRNKILSLGEGIDYIISDPLIAKLGEPVGSFYVYKTAGIFQEGDDFKVSPTQNTKPGSQKYQDINGDGKITQADDRVIVGNAQPKFLGGITNTFSYKGFDLTVFFQGSYGNKLFNQNQQLLELGTGYIGASTTLLNRWTPSNTDTDVHRAIEDPAPTNSDRFIEDASFLRLKNLSLGYSVPQSILSKIKLKQLRIYVSAQNLLTFTSYSGFDPEVSRNEQSTLTQGVDNGVYPNSKTFLGGISIGL